MNFEELVEYAERWGFPFQFDILIGQNGAELFSLKQNRLYEYYKLSPAALKKAIEIMKRFECNPFMYWHQKLLCVKVDDMIHKSAKTSERETLTETGIVIPY